MLPTLAVVVAWTSALPRVGSAGPPQVRSSGVLPVSQAIAQNEAVSPDPIFVNYRRVAALGLDFLLPLVFADDETRAGFARLRPGEVRRIPPADGKPGSPGAHPLIWVWMDGGDLVAAVDENGDARSPGTVPDSVDDCYVVDYDADGTIDRVVDWEDLDGDGRADRQILYSIPETTIQGSRPMTCFVIEQKDAERGFWHLERWQYVQALCQFRCDFSGNQFFTWGQFQDEPQRWKGIVENPFCFYDDDGDGFSDEALQISGDGPAVSTIRWSFDSDDDARTGAEYDYDLSVTAVGRRTIPPQLRNTLRIRGGPLTLLSWRAARQWVRKTRWGRVVLVADEDDRNVDPDDPEARERWEGVIADSPGPGFPRLGAPSCGRVNKRYEYYRRDEQDLRLYRSSVDGRIHLFGAPFGELLIDRTGDGKGDAMLRAEDRDGDGYFDTWLWDDDADGEFDSTFERRDEHVEIVPLERDAIRAAERETAALYGGASQAERFARDIARWSERKQFIPIPAAPLTSADSLPGSAAGIRDEDTYRRAFAAEYPRIKNPRSLSELASAAEYDRIYFDPGLCPEAAEITNEDGSLAWILSRSMMSLNEMYRATGDAKYLRSNLECARAVMAARDDSRGLRLWNRRLPAPVWGCTKYVTDRRTAHVIHTAQILYPILDLLRLIGDREPELIDPAERESLVIRTRESLDFHDDQWQLHPAAEPGSRRDKEARDASEKGAETADDTVATIGSGTSAEAASGKGAKTGAGKDAAAGEETAVDGDEGYYWEDDPRERLPQPANALSLMGATLWLSWKVSGNEAHREKALALGRYLKRRLDVRPDGTYFWSYRLPRDPLNGPEKTAGMTSDDTGHGGLVTMLPLLLAEDGEIFTTADIRRLARTALHGFARLDTGMLYPRVDGGTNAVPPLPSTVAIWLQLSPQAPELYDRISRYYIERVPRPTPLSLALLIRYADVVRDPAEREPDGTDAGE